MEFLVIDDNKACRDAARGVIEREGHYAEGAESGSRGLQRLKEEKFGAVLLDSNLGTDQGLDVLAEIQTRHPGIPVLMFTGQGNVRIAVEAMRRGAVDFLEKPLLREHFLTSLARIQSHRQKAQRPEPSEPNGNGSPAANARPREPLFDFSTPVMRQVMDKLLRAAATPASILILGESGTGKTVLARAAHQHSQLKDKPFVTVSCPSLSKELLESDLFGHVKGSFTGAIKDHWGKVKVAEGGTLFFDEIGELPLEIQSKLLRLLQEREYERIGENVTRTANFRVLAATNCDLRQRVAEGAFREDLYFRLNVIPVELPPLRARKDDLLSFAQHYLQYFATQYGRKLEGFSAAAAACLGQHTWPGNLRELRHAIEHGVIMARENTLAPADLPVEVERGLDVATHFHAGARISLAELSAMHIRRVLEHTPVLTEAAALLGINQATLYRKRHEMGLLSGPGENGKVSRSPAPPCSPCPTTDEP